MENLKDMEKNGNYFVREDIVSEQHVHHKDEYKPERDKLQSQVWLPGKSNESFYRRNEGVNR